MLKDEYNGKVSVIICTYKGSKFLARAIQSVLGQTYDKIELIVVDDNVIGTKDGLETQEVIKGFSGKLVYLQHKTNKNGAAARNTGLKKATGNYICFLDDDDMMLPERISSCVEKLRLSSKCDAVFTDVLCADQNLFPTYKVTVREEGNCYRQVLLNQMFFGTGSNLFFTRKVYETIGLFDESFLRYQDLEYILRFYRLYESTFVPEIYLIKSKNNTDNSLNYEKLKNMNRKFEEKFLDEIESLGYKEKKYFYDVRKKNLYIASLLEPGNKYINKNWIKLSIKDLFLVLLNKSRINNTVLFGFVNKLRIKIKAKKLEKDLPLKVQYFLENNRLKL